MMDEYRRGLAFRFLREAKAELEAAKKVPYMASSLMLEAIRKARFAIYYSLGEPTYLENIINEAARKKVRADPILRLIVKIEDTIQRLIQVDELGNERTLKQADYVITLASHIVKVMIGEKVDG